MDPTGMQYQLKIKQLLDKLMKSECRSEIDVYLDKFVNRLLAQEEKESKCALITLPIFTEWIIQAVATWCTKKITPPTCVTCFTLNLASLLSKNEERFDRLNNNNFFIKLVNISKARQQGVVPSIKLGYIKLLSSFLEHKSGIEMMIACSFWEDIFQYSVMDKNVEVREESKMFMCKILDKIINDDRDFCVNVIQKVMSPLSDNAYKSIRFNSDFTEIPEYLESTIQLIGDILEYFLEGVVFSRNDFRVVLLFWKNFQLEEKISEFTILVQNKTNCFVLELSKIMFIMQFLELYVNRVRNVVTEKDAVASVDTFMHNFISKLSKTDTDSFLKFCSFGYLYVTLIARKIFHFQSSKDNIASKFVNQLLLMNLMPMFCLAMQYGYKVSELEDKLIDDVIRDIFIDKLFRMLNHNSIVRSCYTWRDYIIGVSNVFDVSRDYLASLMKLRKYFSREQGVIIFQTLMYNLKDSTNAVKESRQNLDIFSEKEEFFCSCFEALAVLIEEFEITWKVGCEAIDVMMVSFDMLTLPVWSPEAVTKILKLIDISIAKYMSPNLALLIDRTTDSTIDLLGPLLYSKLHETMEVKRAALEVVRTLSNLSKNKFPSLQKVLMDSELPTLVVKMSTCDGESFVRATAIKCLQEMIQVEDIWNNALKSEDLTQKMRAILFNETEGIVRVEAATFMCIAYEQQQFPKDALDNIYETMIHSSTTDLHWEVKVRALGFWEKVIKNHLQNQGMIDGTFPNVTFSKEHRKIVTLTDSEIRKRLQKILNQLSTIGCLGVLMSAIKDDCDIEVSKTAVKITQRLVELFKKYHIYGDSSAPTSPLPVENGESSVPSVSSGISVDEAMDSPASYQPDFNDEIIDQIVNSKDVYLLKNVYSPSDYGSVTNYDVQVKKIVSPAEFLQYTQQDLNNIIAEKKNWLNGIEDLGSLLDDMLKTYDDDINNMDCY